MGPPTKRGCGAVSYWDCPKCGSDSFHTMPDVPGIKHRAKCFCCLPGRFDLYDIRLCFFGTEGWDARRAIIGQWRQEWEAGQQATPSLTDSHGNTSPKHGGVGGVSVGVNGSSLISPRTRIIMEKSPLQQKWDAERMQYRAGVVWADLTDEQRHAFAEVHRVMRHHESNDLMAAVAKYSHDFEEWRRFTDSLHLAECKDPNCDAIVCRAKIKGPRYYKMLNRNGKPLSVATL